MNSYKMSNGIEISSEIELSNEMIKKVETKVYEENNFTFDGIKTVEVVKDKNSINMNIISVDIECIRRITGYLTGTVDRWNDAKRAEEKDRVKHGIM